MFCELAMEEILILFPVFQHQKGCSLMQMVVKWLNHLQPERDRALILTLMCSAGISYCQWSTSKSILLHLSLHGVCKCLIAVLFISASCKKKKKFIFCSKIALAFLMYYNHRKQVLLLIPEGNFFLTHPQDNTHTPGCSDLQAQGQPLSVRG